ncbi:MAG: hypothetical protein LBG74_08050 [Spirochaetaceae bacterium]|jgi:hypothetical protein|nr:hypothetical protein [Spirochaetaceae bacterium]
MWRKIQAIVGLLCILLFVCVLGWTAITIIDAQGAYKTTAEAEFNELRDFAVSASAFGFMGENYKNDVEAAFSHSKALQALIITGADGRMLTVEKQKGALVWEEDAPRFSKNPLLFGAVFFAPLRIEGMKDAALSVLASPLDYELLVRILRAALFASLLISAAAFATLMLGFIPALNNETDDSGQPESEDSGQEEASAVSDEMAGDDAAPDTDIDDILFDEDALLDSAPLDGEVLPEPGIVQYAGPEDEELSFDSELFSEFDDNEKPEIIETAEIDEEPLPEGELAEIATGFDDFLVELDNIDEEADEEAEEPDAGVSAETDSDAAVDGSPADSADTGVPDNEPEIPVYEGFGDELENSTPKEQRGLLAAAKRIYERDNFTEEKESEQFMTALSTMLQNAVEDGEDLCLAAAEWTEGENSTESLLEIARDFFGESGTVFERMRGGIFVIMNDSNLDEGFAQAKEFYGRVTAENAQDDLLVMGLSSRSGRAVEAERLLKEAQKALEKGHEDDSLPVVAFKVNIEKYNRLYAKAEG